ncbi:MAG TPA: class I SAM-dependent methyltransferase [Planctomycetaceae bacterium]|nr:class I SAM-dependent methyltransferase [Planctomycetaceae bacterium]
MPSDSEISRFYESQYFDILRQGGRAPELRRIMEGGETAKSEIHWLESVLYADIVAALQQLGAGRQLLDVGCGTGDFLAYAGQHGFEPLGLEIATAATERARERGLTVREMTLEEHLAQTAGVRNSVDAVVMLNVLEHVPDPVKMLQLAGEVLRPGGFLCIRVPNDFSEIQEAARAKLNSSPWWIAVPDHINYFTFESLRITFDHCGFDKVYQQSDFPMELFLLMGENYVGDAAKGGACHKRRVELELGLPPHLRRQMYQAFAETGVGRNILMFGRRR